MTDSVAAQFEILGKLLRHDLAHDLDINHDAIVEILDSEIASRYYSDADRVRRMLPSDTVLSEAAAIILDPERYSALLSKPKQ